MMKRTERKTVVLSEAEKDEKLRWFRAYDSLISSSKSKLEGISKLRDFLWDSIDSYVDSESLGAPESPSNARERKCATDNITAAWQGIAADAYRAGVEERESEIKALEEKIKNLHEDYEHLYSEYLQEAAKNEGKVLKDGDGQPGDDCEPN